MTGLRDDGTTPTFAELIEAGVLAVVDDRHVSMTATILSYDTTTQLVDAQPTTRIYQSVEGVEVPLALPAFTQCPVAFPTGGGYTFQFPLTPGDEVLVVCCSHDIDAWLTSGLRDTVPTSRRRGSLSDAVVIPGVRPKTRPRASTSLGGASMGLDDTTCELRVQTTEVVITVPVGGAVKSGSVAASKPAAFGDEVDAYFTLQYAWMQSVQTLLSSIGLPVPTPIVAPPTTSAVKTKVE